MSLARGFFVWLERARLDPPHRIVARAAKVLHQTGVLNAGGDPLAMAQVVLRQGMGVRTMHTIHAAACPGRAAVIDRHRHLDYATLDAEIDAIAHALRSDGAQRGEPVGLMMENRSEYIALWMALTRLGIASAHLGTSSTSAELAPLIERTGIHRVVVSSVTYEVAKRVADEHPELQLRIMNVDASVPDTLGYHAKVRAHRGSAQPRSHEALDAPSVVYTSGTTGRPKGAVRDLQSVGPMELLRILERLPLRVGDRHLVVSPLYHSGAQAFTMINTALGATLVLLDRFDAEEVLDVLWRERIASVFMVPTMLRRILDLPASLHARRPTPVLRAIVSGAAPFPLGLRRRAIERFGADAIFDFYGATELGWVTLTNGHDMLERPGTLGRPLAGQEIRVLDDKGRALPPGEVGTIYTRSGQHMRGYLRDGATTKEGSEAGWATVDDLGYVDDEGHLFLTGRSRDMVISGGVNVYPVEIENVLSEHPTVREVAVIGIPDEQWGERLVAVIVPGGALSIEKLEGWARERLAKAKLPRRWEIVDALPRNPTGKVLKRALQDRFGPSAADTGPSAADS